MYELNWKIKGKLSILNCEQHCLFRVGLSEINYTITDSAEKLNNGLNLSCCYFCTNIAQ